jgi:leucyl aminopeptidase (aminopeptidase T)
MIVMTPRKMHGNEPPRIVAGAMREATVIFAPTTYAITHTEAFKEALKAGARAIILRGVTEDMMIHGAINANYLDIRRRSEILGNVLRKASKILVMSPFGTDLQMEIKGRQVFVLSGFAVKPGTFAALPDGEVALSPVEGTAAGVIVFDSSMDGIGALTNPVRLDVKRGRVINISGGQEAETIKRLIEEVGECGSNIAEFAVGTNPMARLIGNLAEDKKKEGTVHIAVGDNHNLGGEVMCNIHLDGLMTLPTVKVDEKTIIERGQVLWDYVYKLADVE